MNSVYSNRRAKAFTLVEMLVVIAIIGILAALLLPALERTKARAKRIECVSDLREMGVAFHLFANDHGGKFPTQVSTNDGGAQEFVTAGYRIPGLFYFSFKFLRPLAGALGTPKLFACPADLGRWPEVNFDRFSNSNLSYDVGLVTDANDPRMILAADRGLPARFTNGCTIRHLPGPVPARWSGAHGQGGDILFGDGHVELSSDATVVSEEAVNEDVVYPEVKASTTSPATGGGGGGGGGGDGPGSNAPTSTSPGEPSGNGGGPAPVAGMSKAAPQRSIASQSSTPNNRGGGNVSNSTPPTLRASSEAGATASQPSEPAGPQVARPDLEAGQNIRVTVREQTPLEFSNAPPDATVITNAPARTGPGTNDDSMMSAGNRKAAHVLRGFLEGIYFLILLLLLLYAAYRYWCWTQGSNRKRGR